MGSLGIADVAGEMGEVAALDHADVLVELETLAVAEDGQRVFGVGGGDDTFDEGGHDGFGGGGVHLDIEGDDGAEGGARVAVASLDVDLLEGLAGEADRGAAGVHVLHAGAAGIGKELADVEGVGDVLEVGLGEAAFAGLEDLHVPDGALDADGFVVGGGLVGVGAVAEVVDL